MHAKINLIIAAILFSCGVGFSENESSVVKQKLSTNSYYSFRTDHDRDGSGKFFQGREIALTCGDHDWLERPTRETEEKTDLLVDVLKLKPGEIVADVGAGTGYITRKLAKKVGEKGLVYAEDIQAEMLQVLTNKLAASRIQNVRAILGTLTDVGLAPNSVDTILMVDVYHEFDHPFEMMQSIYSALKPGGRLVFVEYRAEDPAVPIKRLHKMSIAQVQKEAALFPLHWRETIETLPRQHIIIFEKDKERFKK